MKIKKYLFPSGSLTKRRLKFTPEQVALFENLSTPAIPGTNNSEKLKLRTEGVLALLHLKYEKEKEAAKIRSRSERPYVLTKKATPAEKLRGSGDEYALTTQIVGMSGRDPLLGTIFDLYVGGKGAESLFKSGSWLYNNGKIILKSIPYNPENFYRAVGKDAIKDALKSGIIRSSSKEYLYNPYFSHGRLFWTGERVIEGRQGPILWVKAKGPNGEYNLNDVIKPGEKNLSSGYVPTEVFPYSNGSTQVSTKGFSYWKKHPIVGWREYKFKQGGKMDKIKKYLNPSGPLVKINGEWVPLVSDGAGSLYAVDKLGKRKNFKVKTKPKSATGNKEIVVTPKGNTIVDKKDLKPKPVGYSSAFQGNLIMAPVRKGFELLGKGLYAGSQALERGFTYGGLPNAFGMYSPEQSKLLMNAPTPGTDATFKYILPYTMPSKWIGWARTGYAPHREENTGFGDEDLNLMFDVASAPFVFKGIKSGIKATPEVIDLGLESASDLGSKTARNWRLAREINLATKSKPNLSNRTISVKRSNNEVTGQPDLVYTLYNEFGEPIGLTNIGGAVFGSGNKTHRMVDGVMSMRNAHKVSEDTYNAAVQDIINNGGKGLESGWSLMMPLKTLAVTSKFPHTVIGLEFGNPVRLLTGTSERPIPQRVLGNHYLELKPFEIKYNESTGNFEQVPITNLEPYVPTSLKFLERKPSRISLAERLGISKGDRNLPFKQKLPTEHIQGEEAVKMFKEYGGTPIPEGSINGEQLRKYVAEARERYGLVGNNNVTDEEIALALYKHSKELGGNTAAVNALGEPLLLFRGDTRRYTQLKERISPEELAKKSGTMDNSLGNLFLGEFPDSWRGVDRYIGTWRNFNGSPKLVGSGTGSKVVWDGKTASEIEGYPYLGPLAGGGYKLYSQPHRYGSIDVYKLPASMMESGVNDLNAFIVRTPQMRNASSEISVLNDDWMLQGAKDSHFMSKNYKYNPKTYSMENVKTGESLGEITTESAPESRAAMGDHYKELLKEAEQKQLGLLKSEANAPLRDEHSLYSYFALPNFNIQGAKHLLPYDLRIPRNWKDKNIYRGLIPLTTGYTLYNIFNQPQLQYLRQGGKMNTLLFLKNGSGIHIKKKNRGKFTDYCGGKVTNSCIAKAKASGNPTLVKRATFAANARKWKH